MVQSSKGENTKVNDGSLVNQSEINYRQDTRSTENEESNLYLTCWGARSKEPGAGFIGKKTIKQ